MSPPWSHDHSWRKMLLSTEVQSNFAAQALPRSALCDHARLDTPTRNMSFRLFSSDNFEAVVASEWRADLEAKPRFQLPPRFCPLAALAPPFSDLCVPTHCEMHARLTHSSLGSGAMYQNYRISNSVDDRECPMAICLCKPRFMRAL